MLEIFGKKKDIFAILAILLVLTSMAYWAIYVTNSYSTFHEYIDVGESAQSMYYHIYYPGVVGGLQYLVFLNHISPDQLLVLPFFYLFQSPLTLLYMQEIVMSLTGLLIFYVARDILKDSRIALLLCATFLINPAMQGIIIYDYHPEFMIIPLAILLFYFYNKQSKPFFYLSLLLLLGVLELSPLVALFLCAGLFVHVAMHEKESKDKKEKLKLAVYGIGLSLLALLFYYSVGAYLTTTYSSASPQLPSYFKIQNFTSGPASGFAQVLSGTSPNLLSQGSSYTTYTYVSVFLFFGVIFIFDPIIALIVYIPWIAGTMFSANFDFTWYYYAAYALGGGYVAAIIGLKLYEEKTGLVAKLLHEHSGVDYAKIKKLIVWSVLIMFLFFLETGSMMSINKNSEPYGSLFLGQNSYSMLSADAQLNSIIKLVPENATVLAEFAVFPHLTPRQYIEHTSSMYFKPEYIIMDFNDSISTITSFDQNAFSNFNYTDYSVYAQNGTAILLKENEIPAPGAQNGIIAPNPNPARVSYIPNYGMLPPIADIYSVINAQNISVLNNRTILLYLWSPSCAACMKLVPYFNALQRTYGGPDFSVVALNTPEFEYEENYTDISTDVNRYGMTYPLILRTVPRLLNASGTANMPVYYVIDSSENLRFRQSGDINYTYMEGVVQELLYGYYSGTSIASSTTENLTISSMDTPERYLGYQTAGQIGNAQGLTPNSIVNYTITGPEDTNTIYLSGRWYDAPDSVYSINDSKLTLTYYAKELYVVASGNSTNITITPEGANLSEMSPGRDAKPLDGKWISTITSPGLYNLVNSTSYGWYTVEMNASTGLRLYAVAPT
jgi:uncharacterized membrane protein